MMNSPTKLFCFDFDNTIVNAHFHALLEGKGVPYKKATAQQIQALLNEHQIHNQTELLDIFKMILRKGHRLAITTWSEYPEVIIPTLKKLGLTAVEIDMIHIVNGLPNTAQDRKSLHIQNAKKHFGIEDDANVCLIDDDEKNINQAIKDGQIGIHVKDAQRNTEYLDQLKNILKPTTKRIRLADMDSREGQRLYELRKDLKAKGKIPAPVRHDGEQPLKRFLAKNLERNAKRARPSHSDENSWTSSVIEGVISVFSYVAKPITYAFSATFLADTAKKAIEPITYKSLCQKPSRK